MAEVGKRKQQKVSSEGTETFVDASSAAAPGKDAMPKNYIRAALAYGVQGFNFAWQKVEHLPQNQRFGAVALALVLLFWPLFTVALFLPWAIVGVIVAYVIFFGFNNLILHLEDAIISEVKLSDKNANHVKEISKNLRLNWESVMKHAKPAAANGCAYAVENFKSVSKTLLEQLNAAISKFVEMLRKLNEQKTAPVKATKK